MQKVKISLVNGDLLNTPCSIAFIKHREGRICGPEEKEIDIKMNGKLTSLYRGHEKQDHIITPSDSIFPFSFLYIITFREEDFPFTYSAVDTYARKIYTPGRKRQKCH